MATAEEATAQGDATKTAVNGADLVTLNCRLILRQQDFGDVKEAPSLAGHQKNAKTYSKKWVDEIMPKIVRVTTDIIDYGNTFTTTVNQVTQILLPRLNNGDKTAVNEMKQVLEYVLVANLQKKRDNANEVTTAVKAFYNDFEPLIKAFEADSKKIAEEMARDDAEIAKKQSELKVEEANRKSLEKKVSDLSKAIIGTACATLIPIYGIFIGIPSTIGVGVALGIAKSDLADSIDKICNLTIELQRMKSEAALLVSVNSQLTGLKEKVDQVVTAADAVYQGWLVLNNNMDNLLTKLDTVNPEGLSIIISVQMADASKAWDEVIAQARLLKPDGLVDVTVGSIDELKKELMKENTGS